MKTLERLYRKRLITLFLTVKITLLLCLSSTAQAEFRHWDEWTEKEKWAFTAFNTIQYIDLQQTRYALSHPCKCYSEGNPLFGDRPHVDKVYLYSAVTTAIVYYGLGISEPNEQLKLMWGVNAVRLGTVIHNNHIGVSWKVAF